WGAFLRPVPRTVCQCGYGGARRGSPQTLNRYAYGLNNPIKYIDPTGHDPDGLDAGGGACSDEWPLTTFDAMVNGCGTNDDCIRTQDHIIDQYLHNLDDQADANNAHLSDTLQNTMESYDVEVAYIDRNVADAHP